MWAELSKAMHLPSPFNISIQPKLEEVEKIESMKWRTGRKPMIAGEIFRREVCGTGDLVLRIFWRTNRFDIGLRIAIYVTAFWFGEQ